MSEEKYDIKDLKTPKGQQKRLNQTSDYLATIK